MRLHTANNNRKRQQRRAVYAEALAYHVARVERMWRSDRLDKLANSGFVLRQRKRRGKYPPASAAAATAP